jgi:DNA-binding LacI/PurR family transcriptional regulator
MDDAGRYGSAKLNFLRYPSMTTIRDVARERGYSITTVSVVLNDAAPSQAISDATKRRNREVAGRLEYHPNLFARSLRRRNSGIIGVLGFDITDPYCTQVLRGMQDNLDKHGCESIVVDIRNDRALCKRSIARLLNGQVRGLIALANSMYIDLDLLKVFDERGIQSVIIGRPGKFESFHSVVVDNAAGARLALEYLWTLGHRRIAFVRSPKVLVDSCERWTSVQEVAREKGLEIRPEFTVELRQRSSTFEEAHQVVRTLLQRNRRFTAVMAFDDMTAFGAVRALSEDGIRVPADCSVIGFDDIAAAAYYNPPLEDLPESLADTLGDLAGSFHCANRQVLTGCSSSFTNRHPGVDRM